LSNLAPLVLTVILAAQPAPPVESDDYELTQIASGFSSPLYLTAPAGDPRLFIVEQGGRIRILENGRVLATPFLNVSSLITPSRGGEQGLLGLAFHPNYSANGRFFIAYTNAGADVVVAEYHATPSSDVADPTAIRRLMTIDHPFSNHNGGMLLFGPDGYLYVGSGDGGGGGDPFGNGQNRNVLLGKILRISVDGDSFPGDSARNYTIPGDNPFVGTSGADEIWLYGLRNPWRFWIDPPTGRHYVADVGQSQREEVTVLGPGSEGSNLGWDRLEGTRCFPSGGSCSTSGTVLPQVEYTHAEGASITGGPVYRGSSMPELAGTYFYGDFAEGWFRSFRFTGAVTEHFDWRSVTPGTSLISSFGVDGRGEMYIVSLGGRIWRFEGRSSEQMIGDFDADGLDDIGIRRGGYFLVADSEASGAGSFASWTSARLSRGASEVITGDFTGDGRGDVASFYPVNGTWWIGRSSGTSFVTTKWADFATNSGWRSQLVGDFNNDGRDDIANFYPANGTWWVSRSTGTGFSTAKWADYATGSGWSQQVVGDFDGDGRDDIANFAPSNGTWWVSRSTGTGFTTTQWADFTTTSGWSSQVVGDFNNDGRDDIANYHSGNGTWWVSRSTGTGFITTQWADFTTASGWTAQIAGDFTGDGRDDIANYHSGNGTWWVSRSTGTGFTTTQWADFTTASGWTAQQVGDFNNDARADIANYYPGNGTWWVSRSGGASFTTTKWAE